MVDRPPQPADDDNTKIHQRRRLAWKLAGAGLLVLGLLVILLACVLWIPQWLYPSLTNTDLKDVHAQNMSDTAKVQELKDARLKLQNDARTTLLQGLGALLVLTGAASGVWVTLRQVRASHDQLKLSEQGQITDRYTKAIDQLDVEKALAVRLGGLYALERIARDSPNDRATIAEVLCAYARTAPRPKPPARRAKEQIRQYGNPQLADIALVGRAAVEPYLTVRAPDVQAAMTILGRWRNRLGDPPPVLDLHNADLRGVGLTDAKLQGADLHGAQLQDAVLARAQLQGAELVDAQLQGADLHSAQLQGANLPYAQLQRADLNGAQLQRANLRGAQLQGAKLFGAQLQGAELTTAKLQGANLHGAQLQDATLHWAQLQGATLIGAQLRGAELATAELQGATASEATQWPEGVDHARARTAGVRLVDPRAWTALAFISSPDEPAPPDKE